MAGLTRRTENAAVCGDVEGGAVARAFDGKRDGGASVACVARVAIVAGVTVLDFPLARAPASTKNAFAELRWGEVRQ